MIYLNSGGVLAGGQTTGMPKGAGSPGRPAPRPASEVRAARMARPIDRLRMMPSETDAQSLTVSMGMEYTGRAALLLSAAELLRPFHP